jgi:DnaK suppressor protein
MPTSVAMPRPDDRPAIDPRALDALRGALVGELAAQQAQLVELHATVAELTGHVDVDSALARELAEQSIERGLEVIADIERAIRSIADGTYGACDGCRGDIALARLEAIPHARHCISCAPTAARLVA